MEILERVEDLPFLRAEVSEQHAGRRPVGRADEARINARCECGRAVAGCGHRGSFRYPSQKRVKDGVELQRAVAEQKVGALHQSAPAM
ncbi:hypothetical protein GCM10022232_18360 [Streptomyces plumbiresistens]|uniref:Transposase n=1 Tax=Streptomyces plumbiresistens TaxID=511811 RepID=A0ABP7QP34_9ACTN